MARLPQVGDTFGRYQIDSQIGQGGMGVVFMATDTSFGRQVALKVVLPILGDNEEFRQRFHREASVLAKLDSPHVIRIFDYGVEDECPYIATQYVRGGDLGSLVNERGPMPAQLAARICSQVADALHDAHEAGIVHRDVKPNNVLLRDADVADLHAYLCDFGIARTNEDGLTAPGAVAGTWSYLAPECGRGQPGTPASDIYSLACTYWSALTGEPPYEGTDVSVAVAHQQSPIRQLVGADQHSAAVNAVLQRALAKDPADRYPTADQFRADLDAIAAIPSGPVQAVPVSAPTPGEIVTGTAAGPTQQRGRRRASGASQPPVSPPPMSPPVSTGSTNGGGSIHGGGSTNGGGSPYGSGSTHAAAPTVVPTGPPPSRPPGAPRKRGRVLAVVGASIGVLVVAGIGIGIATLGDDDSDDPGGTAGSTAPGPQGAEPVTMDLDGDGLGDLAIDVGRFLNRNLYESDTRLWHSDGSKFNEVSTEIYDDNQDTTSRFNFVGHFDDDATSDILTAEFSTQEGYDLRVVGETSAGDAIDSDVPNPEGLRGPVEAADVNGDGQDDLVFSIFESDGDPVGYVWAPFEDGSFGEARTWRTFNGTLDNTQTEVGDYDGDGVADIVVFNHGAKVTRRELTTGTIEIYWGVAGDDADLERGASKPFKAGVDELLTAADIDGDGSDELVLGQTYLGLKLKTMQIGRDGFEAAQPAALSDYGFASYTPVLGVSDVNGDGLDDIVFVAPTDDPRKHEIEVFVSRGGSLTAGVWATFDQEFGNNPDSTDNVEILGEPIA